MASHSQADATDVSASAVLMKAIAAHDWTHNCEMKLEVKLTVNPLNSPGTIAKTFDSNLEVEQSEDSLRLIKQDGTRDGFTGAHTEVLVTPKFRINWQKDVAVQYTESPALIESAASFDRAMPVLGNFLDGAFNDSVYPVFDFKLAEKKGHVQPTMADGKVGDLDCTIVEISGDSWVLRVWVVPLRDFNFAKYTFDSVAAPQLKRFEKHLVVDDISYQRSSDGKWLITGGRYCSREPDVQRPHGQREVKVVVTRNSIDLSPDFKKLNAFEIPPIPNGEMAIRREADKDGNKIPDNSGIKYIWKNGSVVPAYDPKLIDRIREQVQKTK